MTGNDHKVDGKEISSIFVEDSSYGHANVVHLHKGKDGYNDETDDNPQNIKMKAEYIQEMLPYFILEVRKAKTWWHVKAIRPKKGGRYVQTSKGNNESKQPTNTDTKDTTGREGI